MRVKQLSALCPFDKERETSVPPHSPFPTTRHRRRWQSPCWTCSPQGRRGMKKRWAPRNRCTRRSQAPTDGGQRTKSEGYCGESGWCTTLSYERLAQDRCFYNSDQVMQATFPLEIHFNQRSCSFCFTVKRETLMETQILQGTGARAYSMKVIKPWLPVILRWTDAP